MRYKLDEDPQQCRVYLLNFVNLLKNVLLQFKQTCMLFMYYISMRGDDFPYYDKQFTRNLLREHIDAKSQWLIYYYPGDGVQAITILQSQCKNHRW